MFAIITSVIFNLMGLLGTMKVNICMMLLHAFFCCSILGAFYVFLILDCFLRKEQFGVDSSGQESMGDRTILFLLSLPFLVIFIIGCHSMYLVSMILDENKARKQESGEIQQLVEIRMATQNDNRPQESAIIDEIEILQIPDNVQNTNFCVICLEKQRDSIFYPCGHECVCHQCG